MGALVIKTGMQPEANVARASAAKGTLILAGIQTLADLRKNVPRDCGAIISFGLAGGLTAGDARHPLVVGQTIIADKLLTPDGIYLPDPEWRRRLFARTKAYEHVWWSSGIFNTADTPAQRKTLFDQSGAWVIDDESIFVGQFASERGIPFAIMRTISDGADDTVPPAARNALNSNGNANIAEVLMSTLSDPAQLPDLIRIWREFNLSIAELGTAALMVGPTFQWG